MQLTRSVIDIWLHMHGILYKAYMAQHAVNADLDDSLMCWIADTRPQGCTSLQSVVECLDHSYCGRYSMQ